jgi:hypothetical protein
VALRNRRSEVRILSGALRITPGWLGDHGANGYRRDELVEIIQALR